MSTVVCDTRVRHQQTGGVAGGMAVEIARTTTTTVRVTVAPCSATGVAGTGVGMGEGAFGRDGGTVGGGLWVTVHFNTSNRPNTSFYITHRMELTQDKRFTILSQSFHNPFTIPFIVSDAYSVALPSPLSSRVGPRSHWHLPRFLAPLYRSSPTVDSSYAGAAGV